MALELISYTPEELTNTVPRGPDPWHKIEQTVSFEEFEKYKENLKEKQKKRLRKCEEIDGDLRCNHCGSSMRETEVRFLIINRKTREPIGTHFTIEKVVYCINSNCEKPPPMTSSIGVYEPAKSQLKIESSDKIRGHIEKLG